MIQQAVVYNPVLLNSMKEITQAFDVSPSVVKDWVKDNAPIIVEGDGAKRRYSAELNDLHAWRKRHAGIGD